jgi:predicted XRE-type DNA-binding protein
MVEKPRLGEIDYEVGSENVLADVGVANPEEARLKAQLAHQINRVIEQRGLSQADAAALLGISQPKVSNLRFVGKSLYHRREDRLRFSSSSESPQGFPLRTSKIDLKVDTFVGKSLQELTRVAQPVLVIHRVVDSGVS